MGIAHHVDCECPTCYPPARRPAPTSLQPVPITVRTRGYQYTVHRAGRYAGSLTAAITALQHAQGIAADTLADAGAVSAVLDYGRNGQPVDATVTTPYVTVEITRAH